MSDQDDQKNDPCVWCGQPMTPDVGGDWITRPNAGDVCIDCCPCCG